MRRAVANLLLIVMWFASAIAIVVYFSMGGNLLLVSGSMGFAVATVALLDEVAELVTGK
jgi:hypothetical protein